VNPEEIKHEFVDVEAANWSHFTLYSLVEQWEKHVQAM
jgi:hypothetical protein